MHQLYTHYDVCQIHTMAHTNKINKIQRHMYAETVPK